ncbi:MAG: hypothetical protein ACLQKY_01625 [Terracidiphilus sp.]
MANALNTDKQVALIAAPAEGSSVPSIERMKQTIRPTPSGT